MRIDRMILPAVVVTLMAFSSSILVAEGEPSRHWSAQLELTSRYDDNITELSDTDRDRVGDATCKATPSCASRFRIETPDDLVIAPSARVEWERRFSGGRETSVRGEARASRYTRNSIKDHETYSLRFSQDLTAARHQTTLILRAGLMPDFYLRELTVPEESRIQGQTVRASGRFSSTDYSAAIRQVLVPKFLELEASAGRESRNYGAPFDERDGYLSGYGASLTLHPAGGRRISLRGGYRSESYDARGDRAATLALEPDISSDRTALSLGADLRWGRGRRGVVSITLEREKRDFLSKDPADRFHFGRQDTLTQAAVSVRQPLGDTLYLEGGLTREKNDSNLGPGASSPSGDDVTDYGRTVIAASVGWRF